MMVVEILHQKKKYSRRRHLVKLLVLQNKNKRVLCPRSLESFANWQKSAKVKSQIPS